MSKADLRLDWCSYQAAKYAVEHWHYSKTMPNSKLAKVGVWEDDNFIGVVIFGSGANNGLGNRFCLTQFQICELVRVALTGHKNTVSKIVSISLKLLRGAFTNLRLVVSFADPEHGHTGGIYQAMNWIYDGMSIPSDEFIVKGKRLHGRGLRVSLASIGLNNGTTLERARKLDPNAQKIKGSAKHRYLMPLDSAMRAQIEPLRKPYPKRESRGLGEIDSAACPNTQTGGASPTSPLPDLAIERIE